MSRTKKNQIRIRVDGKKRKEPDVRRIAKAIIRLSLDTEAADALLADLEAQEETVRKERRAARHPLPEEESA
jgi:hypothetical protein